MPVAILGTQISLWCFDLRSSSEFKVIIGDGNDIDDLKVAIKEKRKPRFDGFASDELTLWRVNSVQITCELLNDKLKLEAKQKIGKYFSGVQGDNDRVVVRAPNTASSSKKRPHENSIISTGGPIHPYDDVLMFPVYERNIFKEVISGILGGRSYIIHGPYQSGKTTFLLELKNEIRGRNLNLTYLSMPEVTGDILIQKREGFFKFISYRIFKVTLTEREIFAKISELRDPYYVLIDEFQYIFTDTELFDAAKHFFQEISSSNIRYVAVGTFILVDLMKSDGKLISPFNKVTFKKMPLFNSKEMGKIFLSYRDLNVDGIPLNLEAEIEKESCGHPASFMILLTLYHVFQPTTVDLWRICLQKNLAEYINGTHLKYKHMISKMNSDEKIYVCRLIEHMADHWEMKDLSDLTTLNDLDKKLLDVGILYYVGSNFVGFTSCIILRVCIDALFPKVPKSLSRDEVPSNPIKLLELGLNFIDPSTIIDKRVLNKYGSPERALQAALFCIYNSLLPKPMMCLLEVKASGQDQLDLMIVDGDQKLIAYSLKCNQISQSEIKKSLDQAEEYTKYYGMKIYLVNFFPRGHRTPLCLVMLTEK